MEKFNQWNTVKQNTHQKKERVFFHERDVWFCRVGQNVGFEQNGKGENFLRPIIIIKKFNNEVFLGVPLTSKKKEGIFYSFLSGINNTDNYAILSQIKLLDAKRLEYRAGMAKQEEFERLKKDLIRLIK